MAGLNPLVVVWGAVVLGLALSACHARLYRRRNQRLDAILSALAAMPEVGTVSDLARVLGLSAYKTGSLYVDLDLLQRRGRVRSWQNPETRRMHWAVKGGA